MYYVAASTRRDTASSAMVPINHIGLVCSGIILQSSLFSIIYNWSPDVFHAVKQFGCTNNIYEIMANWSFIDMLARCPRQPNLQIFHFRHSGSPSKNPSWLTYCFFALIPFRMLLPFIWMSIISSTNALVSVGIFFSLVPPVLKWPDLVKLVKYWE